MNTSPPPNASARPSTDSINSPLAIMAYLFLPPMMLLTTGLILSLCWPMIPNRWPVHWGLDGKPDGWATKTPVGIFLPLAFGLFLWLILEITAQIVSRLSVAAPGVSARAAAHLADMNAELVRILAIASAFTISAISLWLPLLPPRSPWPIVAFCLASVIGGIACAAWRYRRRFSELKKAGILELKGYEGLFYRNPDDPRLWVPKISGLGYTINFAHRQAWPLFLSLTGLPILFVLIILFIVGFGS